MNDIYLADQDRILKLAAGLIRGVDTPLKLRARSPIDRVEKTYAFASRDDYYTWEIAAQAQRAAAYAGYDPKSLGIEAYVLRSNGNAAMPDRFDTSFFRGMSPDSVERLTVLKANRRVNDAQIDDGLMATLQPVESITSFPEGFETNGQAFLGDLLKAYRSAEHQSYKDNPVFEVLRQTGHPFQYSNGFRDADRLRGDGPIHDDGGVYRG